MNRWSGLVLGLLVCLGMVPLWAQDSTNASATVVTNGSDLSVEGLEKRLKAIEGEGSLGEDVKETLRGNFAEAIEKLNDRDADQAKAAAYGDAVVTSSVRLAELAKEEKALALPENREDLVSAEERALAAGEFKSLVVKEEAELGQARAMASTLETTISNEKLRPGQIREEVSAAQAILQESRAALAQLSDAAAGTVAEGEKALAQARKEAGAAAIAKLKQEQGSSAQRLNLLQAQLDLARGRVTRGLARLQELEKIQASRLDKQAAEAAAEAEVARQAGAEGSAMQEHASAVADLSAELKKVADRIRVIDLDEDQAEQRLADLKREKLLVDRQIEIGGGRGAFAQMLLAQQRDLPAPGEYRRSLGERQTEITEVRFAAFQVEEKLREHADIVRKAGKVNVATRDQVLKLLETRESLLKQLEEEYQRLTRKLGQLDLVERQTFAHVKGFSAVLEEALFWVPSSPKIGVQTIRNLPAGAAWLIRPGRLTEFGSGLSALVMKSPIKSTILVLFFVAVTLLKPRFRREISSHRVEIRRISSDRYSFTMEGFGKVLLMAIPLAALLWVVGQGLSVGLDASDWLQGMGRWLMELAPLVFALIFIWELCRNDGLGDVHFGWTAPHRVRVRRDLALIALVYYPAMWVVFAVAGEESGRFMHSLGRVAYLGAMLWMSWILKHLVRPSDGIFSGLMAQKPDGALSRLRYIWYVAIVGMPLLLAGLACMGYLFTAFELTVRFAGTLGIVGAAYMFYWLLLRWFVIRERRVALEQLQKAQQAKREAAAAALAREGREGSLAAEEGSIPEMEEAAVDLAQVGAQTRHLLRLLVGSVALVGIWFVWAEAMPVLRYLDTEPFLWSATVADLLLGGLILVATVVFAKNLPGILEITVLSNLVVDAGSRYAIAALVQYSIVAVGFVAMFEAVGMDWSQFGWMAAALGVGLGFGLQEIVANFVSGIILLFERPIRVGDVVTIGETSGVVSRIRIRATTITDWDRKEYVVPNKEFITGRLLNWTLSNKVNRVVVKVGVAYGSDTEKVRALLMEVVGAHPDIMDDPGPGVTLESFGDSCLDFTVRCYLPNLDRRLGTIHELHSAIHERFGKEGIEIPFPQRDLNIRSGLGGYGA